MTELLTFMAANGCLSSFLAVLIACTGVVLVSVCGKIVLYAGKMLMRSALVITRGWPPDYLDADGDHVKMTEAADDTKSIAAGLLDAATEAA